MFLNVEVLKSFILLIYFINCLMFNVVVYVL